MGIEERLRRSFEHQATHVRPADDAWPSVQRRMGRATRGPRKVGTIALPCCCPRGVSSWSGPRSAPTPDIHRDQGAV